MSAQHPAITTTSVTVEHKGQRWHAHALERGVLVHREDGPAVAMPYGGASPLARASVFLPSEAAMDALGMPTDVLVELNTRLREVLR